MDIDIEISVSDLRPVSIPVTTTGQPVVQGAAWLAGWSLMETTGAATASFQLTSNGNLVGVVTLLANGSSNVWFGEKGIFCRGDITLTVLSGSIKGAVYATFLKPGYDYQQ